MRTTDLSRRPALDPLIERLRAADIRLWVDEGQLRYSAPPGALTEPLAAEIRANKPDLIALLSTPGPGAASPAAIPRVPRTGAMPVSLAQQRFWLLYHLDGGGSTYNVPKAVRIRGALDVPALEEAFRDVIARHEALRTSFATDAGTPVQRIQEHVPFHIPIDDAGGRAIEERLRSARARVAKEAGQPFDLAVAPLLRARLLKVDAADHVLTVVLHHIVADGRSLEILFEEVAAAYAARRAGRAPVFAPLPLQYADYAAYERSRVADASFTQRVEWWKATLEDAPALLQLPADRPRPAAQSFAGDLEQFALGPDLTRHVRALAAREGATPYMVLMAALACVLSRYSGQDDVCIGSPVENRLHHDVERLIGAFINTVVVRVRLNSEDDFVSLLRRVRDTALDAVEHQDVPFERLVETLQPDRGIAASPLFQVAVSWLNAERGFLRLEGVDVEPFDFDYRSVKFDLNLEVYESPSDLHVAWFYSTALFERATVRRMIGHFRRVLASVTSDSAQPVARMALLDADERRTVLDGFNTIESVPAPVPTLLHAFQTAAKHHRDAVAVSDDGRDLSYADLDARSSALAAHLSARGVKAGGVVAVLLEPSIDLMVTLLGVLKAGAAYLPLDLRVPQARLAFMLEDADAAVLVTTPAVLGSRRVSANTHVIDARAGGDDRSAEAFALRDDVDARGAAYVIYTSGSTGTPKGVVIEHGSLINYLWWAWHTYGPGRPLDFPLFTSVAFDLTVTSLFVPLISGGRVVIYRDTGGVPAVFQVFREQQVDVVKLTPAHLAMVGAVDLSAGRVRTLVLGGEDLKAESCRRAHDASGGAVTIYNEYGPTEATVGCMIHRFDAAADTGGSVPIGRPGANARIYVLDPAGEPSPIGVPGEIWVSGPGVAREYLRRPELTAERFHPDPFAAGLRMYRTGDIARWRTDGVLEYLGRRDHQVKIRGHRVELDEIAAAIAAHERVSDCTVIVAERRATTAEPGDIRRCVRCGLASTYPGTRINDEGVCDMCVAFDTHAARVNAYFRTPEDLRALFDRARARAHREREGFSRATDDYDCLALVSGGKDSVYMLARLREMGVRILAYTLDPGYLSEEARANIRHVTGLLGIDHVFGGTPHMNEIFVESLKQHANVCNGCFKTLYTLSLKLAHERGIPVIVTGLSRGQFFETRLSKYYNAPAFDAGEVDRSILEARRIYHRLDDVISRRIDVAFLRDDAVFEQVEIVDFYRYVDVSLSDMLAYLEGIGWKRPSDTGRSTNCLINDVGIYVHRRKRGYHNYALPYSWDVRMGHKTRDEAVEELEDEIDEQRVRTILRDIGWTEDLDGERRAEQLLVAYYVPRGDAPPEEVRQAVTTRLPDAMVPDVFVPMPSLPLTRHGKIDRKALPVPDLARASGGRERVAPRNDLESSVAAIWADALGFDTFGVHDNFFALGGHSLMATRVAARIGEVLHVDVPLATLFERPTIAEIAGTLGGAAVARAQTFEDLLAEVEGLPDDEARARLNP